MLEAVTCKWYLMEESCRGTKACMQTLTCQEGGCGLIEGRAGAKIPVTWAPSVLRMCEFQYCGEPVTYTTLSTDTSSINKMTADLSFIHVSPIIRHSFPHSPSSHNAALHPSHYRAWKLTQLSCSPKTRPPAQAMEGGQSIHWVDPITDLYQMMVD